MPFLLPIFERIEKLLSFCGTDRLFPRLLRLLVLLPILLVLLLILLLLLLVLILLLLILLVLLLILLLLLLVLILLLLILLVLLLILLLLLLVLLLQLFQRQLEIDLGILIGRSQIQRLLIRFDRLLKGLLLKEGIAHIVMGLGAGSFPRCPGRPFELLQGLLVVAAFEERVPDIKVQLGCIGPVYERVAIQLERRVVLPALVERQGLGALLRDRIAHSRPQQRQPDPQQHQRPHKIYHAKRPFHSRDRTRASPRKASVKKQHSANNNGHWNRSS